MFIVDPTMNVVKLARVLQLLAGASLEDEYRDLILYLPNI
jgi:hypothetical protein